MTFTPTKDMIPLKCQLGFDVHRDANGKMHSNCGHEQCIPSACERLKRFGLEQKLVELVP